MNLKKIIIPLFPIDLQQKIAQHIRQLHAWYKTKKFLKDTKCAVGIAIKQDEPITLE